MTEQDVQKFYHTAEWTKTRDYVIRKNAICQHIDEDGRRCDQASRVVHHLVSPLDDWNRRTDWSNLTAVCPTHHQGGQRGETQGYRYAPTVGPDPGYGCEQQVFVHVQKTDEPVKTGVAGPQFTAGTLKPEIVDALLADVADTTEEELMDLMNTSHTRAALYAGMKVAPAAMEELKRCQEKYSGREGWTEYL